MNDYDKQINEYLASELEGKLFVHIEFYKTFGETYSIHKDYYTCKNGKVCCVNDGRECFTDDKLIELRMIKQVGEYDPKETYKRVIKNYSYEEFLILHEL